MGKSASAIRYASTLLCCYRRRRLLAAAAAACRRRSRRWILHRQLQALRSRGRLPPVRRLSCGCGCPRAQEKAARAHQAQECGRAAQEDDPARRQGEGGSGAHRLGSARRPGCMGQRKDHGGELRGEPHGAPRDRTADGAAAVVRCSRACTDGMLLLLLLVLLDAAGCCWLLLADGRSSASTTG